MRRLILVEGAQGVGKTTITNILREKIPYSNLLRLSGIEDKTGPLAVHKISIWYQQLASTIMTGLYSGFDIILDRYMTTEAVYRRLGYGGRDISRELQNNLDIWGDTITRQQMSGEPVYKMYFILLEASEESIDFYMNKRGNKVEHAGVHFKASNSMAQQEQFKLMWEELPATFIKKTISVNNKQPEQIAQEILDFIQEDEYGSSKG